MADKYLQDRVVSALNPCSPELHVQHNTETCHFSQFLPTKPKLNPGFAAFGHQRSPRFTSPSPPFDRGRNLLMKPVTPGYLLSARGSANLNSNVQTALQVVVKELSVRALPIPTVLARYTIQRPGRHQPKPQPTLFSPFRL